MVCTITALVPDSDDVVTVRVWFPKQQPPKKTMKVVVWCLGRRVQVDSIVVRIIASENDNPHISRFDIRVTQRSFPGWPSWGMDAWPLQRVGESKTTKEKRHALPPQKKKKNGLRRSGVSNNNTSFPSNRQTQGITFFFKYLTSPSLRSYHKYKFPGKKKKKGVCWRKISVHCRDVGLESRNVESSMTGQRFSTGSWRRSKEGSDSAVCTDIALFVRA